MTGVNQPAASVIFLEGRASFPRPLNLAAYHHLGVEFEVAVRLGDDLPASGAPWTRASVAGRVAACLPAFELVEDGTPTTRRATPSPSSPRTRGTAGSSSERR